jgi:hypothetical protein
MNSARRIALGHFAVSTLASIPCLALPGAAGCENESPSPQTFAPEGGSAAEGGVDSALEGGRDPVREARADVGEDDGSMMGTTPPSDAAAEGESAGDATPFEDGSAPCASLFCEDFETGQIVPATWDINATAGNTVTVQQTKVAHGRYAAQFHAAPSSMGYDFLIAKNAPSQLRTHHFGRAYVLVDPKLPGGHTGLMFAGSSGFPRLKYLEVAGIRGGWQLSFVQLVGAPTGEVDFHIGCAGNSSCTPTIRMPLQTWTCIEWEFNDQPDQIALTDDRNPIAVASPILFNNQATGLVGGFTDFGFGFYDWHPESFAFDVYYDDIALDTKPIGCL